MGGSFSLSIDVEPYGTDWIVYDKPIWITVSASSGSGDDSINVQAGINRDASSRDGWIIVKLSGRSEQQQCYVYQNAGGGSL
jgi:hypothetical protein